MTVGSLVQGKRKAMGLSCGEAADRCGVSRQVLSNVERDKHAPSLATSIRLIDGLAIDPLVFLREARHACS